MIRPGISLTKEIFIASGLGLCGGALWRVRALEGSNPTVLLRGRWPPLGCAPPLVREQPVWASARWCGEPEACAPPAAV